MVTRTRKRCSARSKNKNNRRDGLVIKKIRIGKER